MSHRPQWAVCAFVMFAGFSAAAAEVRVDHMIDVFNDVCVAPKTSAEMLEAANKFAREKKWKLIKSGESPAPFLHNENGPKVSMTSGWELSHSKISRISLIVSALKQEVVDEQAAFMGAKHSICIMNLGSAIPLERVSNALSDRFQSIMTKDTTRNQKDNEIWSLNENIQDRKCPRKIFLSAKFDFKANSNLINIVLVDLFYPENREWFDILKETRCLI